VPGPPADRLYVALGASEYAKGAACGSHLDVTGPRGTVRALVMDQCGGCPPGKLDLSKQAFARIANLSQGIVPVTYRAAVDPPLPGPLTFRMKQGASQWWFALQVGNHGNPLRTVEAMRAGGAWRAAARQDDNYWIIDGGIGPGPYSIRVTDVYGHRVVVPGIRMVPEQLQRGAIRMYGADAAPQAAPPSPTAAPPTPSASPGAPLALAVATATATPTTCGS
jgi:expansin (peptidoglycan-binding protein)